MSISEAVIVGTGHCPARAVSEILLLYGRGAAPPLQYEMLHLVQGPLGMIGLGLVGNGSDGLSLDAVLGVIAEKVYIIQKVVLLLLHFLHNGHGGNHIIHSPVGIDHLSGEAVGFDGAAELVGEGVPVLASGLYFLTISCSLKYLGVTSPHSEMGAS